MAEFFTSDHHFFHHKVIEYCSRPFIGVKDMHAVMIERWNAVVKPLDIVYYLGDFGLSHKHKLREIMESLNGDKILIKGNHDGHSRRAYIEKVGFKDVVPSLFVHDLYLCHYPRVGDTQKEERYNLRRLQLDEKQWLICGHVHDAWRINGRDFNVGVDVNDFYPVRLDNLLLEIEQIEAEYAREN